MVTRFLSEGFTFTYRRNLNYAQTSSRLPFLQCAPVLETLHLELAELRKASSDRNQSVGLPSKYKFQLSAGVFYRIPDNRVRITARVYQVKRLGINIYIYTLLSLNKSTTLTITLVYHSYSTT
jgi:hypothetical protein